jgi:phage terminase small subunit
LTAKQARFVAEYLIDLNATRAAKACGYHPKTAAKLVAKSSIAAAILAGQTRDLEKAGVTKDRLLQELGAVACVNAREYWNADGSAKHPLQLSADQGAALAGFEVLIKNAKAGDGITDTIHKFKLWDKVRAIELYMKHYGMLVEKVEVKTVDAEARVARLVAARKRVGRHE